jgi:hypothetical protein
MKVTIICIRLALLTLTSMAVAQPLPQPKTGNVPRATVTAEDTAHP